jgi:hypothetical protein
VKHPTFGKLAKPAEYLKNLTNSLSVNPVEFLTADAKTRVARLVEALPIRIEASQIGFVPADIIQFSHVNLDDDHAMIAIEKLRRTMFDMRTGVNRSLKDKQATVRQLAETVPEAPPEGAWKSQLADANAEYEAMRVKVTAALREMTAKKEGDKASADAEYTRVRDEINDRKNAEIKRATEAAELAIAEAAAARDEILRSAYDTEAQKRAELESEYRPKEADLKERIGRAQAMIEQEARAAETRKLAERMEGEARQLSEDAGRLTDALSHLEKLKTSLLSSIPIPGLEVKDGEISVNGVPWDMLNEAARVGIAIEVAKLCAGELGLVLVDGLENLDEKNYQAFKQAALKSDVQFIVTRVSNHPLKVETAVA